MIMTKLFAVLASLAAAVVAQRIQIFPHKGKSFSLDHQNEESFLPGDNMTISLLRPNTQSSVTEIGIGIAIKHCDSACVDDGTLGKILYAGPYAPNMDPKAQNMPNQDFKVTIPSDLGEGNALISVAHASFIGAGTSFFTEVVNATIHIGGSSRCKS